jgi:hypothetical protein
MPVRSTLPDIGAQIAPLLEAVPVEVRPPLVAKLERAAAERYDAWAAACADAVQAEGLRECARRERDIADRVDDLFPLRADQDRRCGEALSGIAETYRAAMAERPESEQYAIQAAAERSGAAFWRAVASAVPDAATREELERCAALEEANATFLESRS